MSELRVDQFSKHLFWDAKKSEIDFEKNKSYVIWQVLEYGKLEDWKLIHKHFGIQGIAETAMNFRTLEPKALNFISLLSGIPKEKFRCFTYQQLLPPHWYF